MESVVVVDYETYWDVEYSLSKMTTESYVRDERFKVHGAGIKTGTKPARWVPAKYLPQVFANLQLDKRAVIEYNGLFEGSILAWHYNIIPKLHLDGLGIARAVLGAHVPRHGLDYVAKYLFGEGKSEGLYETRGVRDLSKPLEGRLGNYCENDCELEYRVVKTLLPYMPREELLALDWTIRAFAEPTLWLDTDLLTSYREEVLQRKADAIRNAGLEDRKTLMSNDKFAEALLTLGVVPPTKVSPKTGKVAWAFAKTDEGLKALLEHDNIEVQALVAARLEVKTTIEETRAQRLLEASVRGEWPVPYNYAGAHTTQRHSGADKVNAQNFKRGGTLRDCIYAPEGYTLGVADLAQIECRLVLWLGSQMAKTTGTERESLDLLAGGGDLYSWFGSLFYGREINKRDNPLERQISKSGVLGLGYGMGALKLITYAMSQGVSMDAVTAEGLVNLYRNMYKGVKQLWGLVDKALRAAVRGEPIPELPCVVLEQDPFGAWGFRRPSGLYNKYPGLGIDGDNQLFYYNGAQQTKLYGAKGVENICQSLAGDIIRRKILKINRHYRCPMTTHDDLVSLVPLGYEEEYKTFATGVMTESPPWAPDLPLGVEVHIGQRYGEAK